MLLLHAPDKLKPGHRPVCLAIGMFDGVHLGHQQVIRQALGDAERWEAHSVVVTFDRHPNAVVAPNRVPPLIYSLPQKLRAIERLGVEATLVLRFDAAFSRQSGEEFVRALAGGFGKIASVCVGAEFTFGHRRGGNVSLLQRFGSDLGFSVHGLSAVSLDGEVVSSTRIRQAIGSGNLDSAGQMLGRAWSLAGEVVRGEGLGATLGVPTANIHHAGLALPPRGVYAAHARVGGRSHRAVLNIGVRPTVQATSIEPRVEAHLLDYSGDLYGQELELTFVRKLRDETRFASLDALKAQLSRDIEVARSCFDS